MTSGTRDQREAFVEDQNSACGGNFDRAAGRAGGGGEVAGMEVLVSYIDSDGGRNILLRRI